MKRKLRTLSEIAVLIFAGGIIGYAISTKPVISPKESLKIHIDSVLNKIKERDSVLTHLHEVNDSLNKIKETGDRNLAYRIQIMDSIIRQDSCSDNDVKKSLEWIKEYNSLLD